MPAEVSQAVSQPDRLELVPINRDDANAFVRRHHRHHPPVRGCICQVAVALGERIVGVAIVGRPKARRAQDGWTAEVTRVATDGTPHASSKLYAACWRAARALGYRKLITYILPSEGGVSLKAAGFREVAKTKGGSWDRRARPRVDRHPTQAKLRWERAA